ncbi:MAG: hypothetical protein Q8L54_16285 [Devosia sp.]|nr:hypothetical protein [Devosia sp.]
MDTDLATALEAARPTAARFTAQIAMVKANHELEMAAVRMVDEVSRPAPPPGQGAKLDKMA